MRTPFVKIFNQYSGLFHSAQAYRGIVYQNWATILFFFITMHLLAGMLATGIFAFRTFPKNAADLQDLISITSQQVPAQMNISWNDENQELLLSNAEFPLQIENTVYKDNQLFNDMQLDLLAKNVVTIDPSIADIQEIESTYPDSFLTFGKNSLVFSSQRAEQIGSVSYTELFESTPSFSTTSEEIFIDLSQGLEKVKTSILKYIPLIALASTVFVVVFSISNLLLDTFFMILLVKLNGFKITISQTIRLSLLIGSIACVMNQISVLLYPTLNWPFYSITFWLIAMYVLLLNKKMW